MTTTPMTTKKKVSVLTACYNEEENVAELVNAVREVFANLSQYDYEHVFIDNASADKTVDILREIAGRDPHVKVIVNIRNFGHIRSPFHGLISCDGDAVISLVADFQDPPELIAAFLAKWEEGYKIVIGVKNQSREKPIMFSIRKFFYNLLSKASDSGDPPVKNFTGFGLYDKKFIDVIRTLDDPYPYFRGLITELGFKRHEVKYTQPQRKGGKTKNNFFTLYDMAMLGFVNHSKLPLRLSAFIGFVTSIISFMTALVYLIYKLVFWQDFEVGIAPLVIGLFFFSSVQLFFIGVVGEYIGAIHTQVRKRPMVIEKERINF
ncbi:MAG TPA: glycosyltransferase family 2 protein [Cyclobacteriaceae bacterium]|nr:glycosyltransferase family 2 protein [Cyclobacteriaceae bacterium]